MKRSMTKAEAQAWRQRWLRVNEFQDEELRRASASERLDQFNTLLGWAQEMGWKADLAKGEAETRRRWIRLRKHYLGKKGA